MIEHSPIDIRAVHLLRDGKSVCGMLEMFPADKLTPDQQESLIGYSRSTDRQSCATCGECRARAKSTPKKACLRCGDSPFVGGGFLNGVCRNCREEESQ